MMREGLNWSASCGPAQRLLGFGFSGRVRPFWAFFLSPRLFWAFFLYPRCFWAFFLSPGRPGSGTLPDCNPLKAHPDNCLFLSCLCLLSCFCFRAFRGVAFLLPMQRPRKLA